MTRNKAKTNTKKSSLKPNQAVPFIEHIYELRRRLFYIVLSVGVWSAAAYGVQQHITNILLKPAKGQQFIYTSPGGGIDFLFRVCVYTGIALSIPVIFYQILRYIEPLIRKDSTRFIMIGSIISGFLAIGGVLFGYYAGLPAALNFLLHQFTTVQIHPLVTIQAYIKFVTVYMLGSALMFQVPLIILFINRIRPLTPKQLFHYERWVILFAFVAAGLMNPTPNLIDQLFVAGPIILTYQMSIGFVAFTNRRKRVGKIEKLLQKDAAIQAARLEKLQAAKALWQQPQTVIKLASQQQDAKAAAIAQVSPQPSQARTATSAAPHSATTKPSHTPRGRDYVVAQRRPAQRRHVYLSDFGGSMRSYS